MLRRLLLLAFYVSLTIAVECDKCTVKECFRTCFYLQKVRSTEAKYKCCSASADGDDRGDGRGDDRGVARCFTIVGDTLRDGCDGSAPGLDQCFLQDGGDCASCCAACTITTDLDNIYKETCVLSLIHI